jgi:serine O-acetyltransferase
LKNVRKDIAAANGHWLKVVLTNRGFHALLFYRISNWMYRRKIPIIPLILTRIIQVLYSIDIDYRATIHGGVRILHGVGVVIGRGAVIESGCVIYHGVTLGLSHSTSRQTGFPYVEKDVLLGAGAKVLGPVIIGSGAKIGANAVVISDVPAGAVAVGIPARVIKQPMEIIN